MTRSIPFNEFSDLIHSIRAVYQSGSEGDFQHETNNQRDLIKLHNGDLEQLSGKVINSLSDQVKQQYSMFCRYNQFSINIRNYHKFYNSVLFGDLKRILKEIPYLSIVDEEVTYNQHMHPMRHRKMNLTLFKWTDEATKFEIKNSEWINKFKQLNAKTADHLSMFYELTNWRMILFLDAQRVINQLKNVHRSTDVDKVDVEPKMDTIDSPNVDSVDGFRTQNFATESNIGLTDEKSTRLMNTDATDDFRPLNLTGWTATDLSTDVSTDVSNQTTKLTSVKPKYLSTDLSTDLSTNLSTDSSNKTTRSTNVKTNYLSTDLSTDLSNKTTRSANVKTKYSSYEHVSTKFVDQLEKSISMLTKKTKAFEDLFNEVHDKFIDLIENDIQLTEQIYSSLIERTNSEQSSCNSPPAENHSQCDCYKSLVDQLPTRTAYLKSLLI